jgi:membrane protease YdiL (CAAX protease family)
MENRVIVNSQKWSSSVVGSVWTITLLASMLPDAIWQSSTGTSPTWLVWAKTGLLAMLFLLSIIWKNIRSLRLFFLMLLILIPAYQWLTIWLPTLPLWKQWFGQGEWFVGTSAIRIAKIGIAFLMMGILSFTGRQRRDYFLIKGQLNAPAENIRWLGITKGTPWSHVAPIIAMCAFVPVLVVLWLSDSPSSALLIKALPYLPASILFAAMNGFGEEMSFRAPFLAALQGQVDKRQQVMLTSIYFGLSHYSGGVSAGIIWVVFAGFLGWLMGRSMLETKGAFWAWLIHFMEDIPIFFFMAIDYLG